MFRLKINSVLTDESSEKFFGNGPARLLAGVQEYGSLSASAKAMDMSYSKALKIIRRAEKALGFSLLESRSGGSDGGASKLSAKAELFLSLYLDFALANKIHGEAGLDGLELMDTDDVKIIVLASGQGERFKENKLLYELCGRPMISYVLKTLRPIKENCIVSTIHSKIRNIAEDLGYVCAFHEDPSLSASIKAGLAMIKEPCPVVFVQADQPLLTLTSLMRLIKVGHDSEGSLCKLSFNGRKAAPTLFPASCFGDLNDLQGEQGGSALIKKDLSLKVEAVEALFPWEIWDIDTKETLPIFEDLIVYLGKEGR